MVTVRDLSIQYNVISFGYLIKTYLMYSCRHKIRSSCLGGMMTFELLIFNPQHTFNVYSLVKLKFRDNIYTYTHRQ